MKGLSPVEEATLAKLVSRAKDGDPEALDSVIGALQHDIFWLALRMTANREDAEDATQEILVKVVTGLGGFRGDSSIRTWAYRRTCRSARTASPFASRARCVGD
jgi:RNA polymerase sigma factor (sigma-70 family)